MANDFNLQKFLIENKMTRNSQLLNEASNNEPTDEDYIATKNKVKNYLELAFKEINDYEDRTIPQGADFSNVGFPSKLLSSIALEVEGFIDYLK
jgi:hypothetical protein